MAVTVPVKDGKIVDPTASANSLSTTNKKSNSSLDKEAFLQLLVAQMKYQDPLEPTSNTEYISQLATFSSLEEMQNLNSTMEANQATNLVGKTVIMKTTNALGETDYVTGKVDYIMRENGKTYLSIEDGLYSLDDLDTVVDEEYLDATNIADEFETEVNKFPDPKKLTVDLQEKLSAVALAYDKLTTYQKNYIKKYKKEALEKLTALVEKMNQLVGNKGDGAEGSDDKKTEGTDSAGSGKDDTSK